MSVIINDIVEAYGFVNINDASSYISSDVASQSEVDKLKDEVEILKRKTDVEYAKECVRKEILDEYNKLVLSDIWFDACKEYVRKRIDEICDSYNKEWFLSSGGFLTIGSGIGGNWTNDIVFKLNDKEVKISELLNPYPEIEGLEFEKFVINYCNEKKGN
jgi:hypothetical protein